MYRCLCVCVRGVRVRVSFSYKEVFTVENFRCMANMMCRSYGQVLASLETAHHLWASLGFPRDSSVSVGKAWLPSRQPGICGQVLASLETALYLWATFGLPRESPTSVATIGSRETAPAVSVVTYWLSRDSQVSVLLNKSAVTIDDVVGLVYFCVYLCPPLVLMSSVRIVPSAGINVISENTALRWY